MVIGNCTYFCAVSYGLFFSLVLPKAELAMAMVPFITLPFMLFGGFFVNQGNVPYYFYPFQYMSMFTYGYQSAIQVFFYFFLNINVSDVFKE